MLRQKLQGDDAVEAGVPGLVYDPHPTFPQFLKYFELTDLLTNHGDAFFR